MSLLDWFRPKWRHSDPEVRAAAVKPLDDRELVAKIARSDGDARVRRIAVNKIDDPSLLHELAQAEADAALKQLIAERARRILVDTVKKGGDGAERALASLDDEADLVELAKSAADEALRRKALARLTDEESLVEGARGAKDNATRDAAIAAVKDGARLHALALKEPRKEVALAALARIDGADALAEIVEKTKSKSVRKAAQEKLRALVAASPETGTGTLARVATKRQVSTESKQHARRAQLCRQLESLVDGAGVELHRIEAEVAEARAAWQSLGEPPPDEAELARRFQRAGDAALARLEAFRKAREEREAEERAQAAAAEAKRIADEKRRAEEAERRQHAEEDARRTDAERAARRQADDERRAAETARKQALTDEEKAQQAENLRRMEEVAAHVEQLAEMADTRAAEKQLKEAQGVLASIGPAPRDESLQVKERIRVARERLMARVRENREADDWKRWANLSKLEDLCVRIDVLRSRVVLPVKPAEAAASAPQTEHATPKLEEGPRLVEGGGLDGDAPSAPTGAAPTAAMHEQPTEKVALAAPITATGDAPQPVLDQPTVKVPAAEQQAAATASLTVEEPIPLAEALQLLKLLQEEWKKVGAAPREKSQALWQKFKKTADEIYGLSRAEFAEKDAERQQNLSEKLALCEQAEQIASSVTAAGATPDWKLEAERVKALQAAWKAIGPVPKAEADAVWQRFRGACDRFFDRRKQDFDKLDAERAANAKKKRSLVEEVEAVADSPDVREAIKVIKQVQAEWKTVGPVPKAEADALWKRFRAACDRAFTRARGGEHRAEADAVANAAPEAQADAHGEPSTEERAESPAGGAGESSTGAEKKDGPST